MRIAFVTDEYATENTFDGGLANYLYRVSIALKSMGHDPVIFTIADKDEILIHNDIKVHRIKPRNISKLKKKILLKGKKNEWLWISYELNRVLKSEHKKEPFDIVQYPNVNMVGYYRIKNIPSVLRISSYTPLWHKAYELDINKGMKINIELEAKTFKKADSVFGPGRVVNSIVEKELGISVKTIETPIFLETKSENNEIIDMIGDKKYLLFYGRLGLMKGVKTIADALPDFFEKYPDYYFIFIGKCLYHSNFNELAYIIDKAKKYQNRILYFDKTRHEKLYPVIKKAEAIILPSRIDNFPNACIEAMAHKKVVIGTNNASFEQLIEDGKSGFLCEIDNPQSLLSKIDEALALTEGKKHQIGERANERIQKLKPEITVNELLGFYSDVIKNFKKI